jgi:glucosylceramidase
MVAVLQVDWNILLDTEGGPNWAGNVVDAPILVDTKTGSGRWYLNPSFFYLSHFSRFIQPGARRVGLDLSDAPVFSRVEATAFVNTNGLLIVVIINRGLHEHQCHLELAGLGQVQLSVPRRGIQTVVFRLEALEAAEAS